MDADLRAIVFANDPVYHDGPVVRYPRLAGAFWSLEWSHPSVKRCTTLARDVRGVESAFARILDEHGGQTVVLRAWRIEIVGVPSWLLHAFRDARAADAVWHFRNAIEGEARQIAPAGPKRFKARLPAALAWCGEYRADPEGHYDAMELKELLADEASGAHEYCANCAKGVVPSGGRSWEALLAAHIATWSEHGWYFTDRRVDGEAPPAAPPPAEDAPLWVLREGGFLDGDSGLGWQRLTAEPNTGSDEESGVAARDITHGVRAFGVRLANEPERLDPLRARITACAVAERAERMARDETWQRESAERRARDAVRLWTWLGEAPPSAKPPRKRA